MLTQENLEAVMALLDHFGHTYAITIDPWDNVPCVSTEFKEVLHWVDSYAYDRVDIISSHYGSRIILVVQEDNNDTMRLTYFKDQRQMFSFPGVPIEVIHAIISSWLR